MAPTLDEYWASFKELAYYIFSYTVIMVTAFYTIAGVLMFFMNFRWRCIYLPFLYFVFGLCFGLVDAFFVTTPLAAFYSAVPYSVSKLRTIYIALFQSILICYIRFARNNKRSPFLIV